MTDNSLNTAQPLGVLGSKPITRRDLVNRSDRFDFFKFSLKRSSNVNLQLSGLKGNADLFLLNKAGKAIAQSRQGGNSPELLTRTLAKGTYYVQVLNRSKGGTKYKLTSSAMAGDGGGGGTGTSTSPIDLGKLEGGLFTRSRDTAGSFGSGKYYKFTLGQISDLSIALSQVSGGGRMTLYRDINRDGQLDNRDTPFITGGSGSESSNEPISLVLPATETYFLEVNRDSSANTMLYDLILSTTQSPGNLPTDPGAELATAFNFGTLNPGGRFEAKDYVGNVDGTDFYRFSLGSATNVTFAKQDVAGDINTNITIYQDKNGNGILESGDTIGSLFGPQASQVLQAGTYYVSAKQANVNNTAYSLTISA